MSHLTGVTRRADKPDVTMFMAESLEGYKRCAAGDLIVNTMWAFMGAVGVAQEPGVVSPSYNVYRLREPDGYHTRFLDLLYRTPVYKSEMFRYSQGVWHSRLRLYPDAFFDLRTLSPPPDEQSRILARVSALDTGDKHLSTQLHTSIETLREYRTALISAAVTGKIDVRGEAD